MNLIEELRPLFGPGKVLVIKEGDKGSNDLEDYAGLLVNLANKYYTIPVDRMYDIVIDTILFYNKYTQKTTKKTNTASLLKLGINQGAINYIGVKRNQMHDTAYSLDYLMESGIQFEG